MGFWDFAYLLGVWDCTYIEFLISRFSFVIDLNNELLLLHCVSRLCQTLKDKNYKMF